jgi:hypothetical protein
VGKILQLKSERQQGGSCGTKHKASKNETGGNNDLLPHFFAESYSRIDNLLLSPPHACCQFKARLIKHVQSGAQAPSAHDADRSKCDDNEKQHGNFEEPLHGQHE